MNCKQPNCEGIIQVEGKTWRDVDQVKASNINNDLYFELSDGEIHYEETAFCSDCEKEYTPRDLLNIKG